MTVEIRHLRCFLAIADEGNLTRAAARLSFSQPALSRTLAQLEREVGARLVDRSTHHLELTDAGRRFERSALDAVRAFDRAVASATQPVRPLRLGHSWSAGTYLSAIVRGWNASRPAPALVVVRSEDRSAGLTTGTADVALTRGPIDRKRFRSVVIDEEPRVAVLHADHPLSRRRKLRLADLSDEPLVQTSVGTTTPELWPAGHRPKVAIEVSTVDDWLVAIASGIGFGVSVVSTAVLHPHPDVRYVALVDSPPVPLFLAWPRTGEHPSLEEFVRIARAATAPLRHEPVAGVSAGSGGSRGAAR